MTQYNKLYQKLFANIKSVQNEITDGELHEGLSFDNTTGCISGSCSSKVVTTLTITASNELNSMSNDVTLIIKGTKYRMAVQCNEIIYQQS